MDGLEYFWFKNIKRLDKKHRLGHGEVYARDGSVRDFKIGGNVVSATVHITPEKIHHVEIMFKKFTNEQKNRLSNLFNLESFSMDISSEILDSGIDVLSVSPDDLEISCSCSHDETFCRDVAAVLHVLGDEVIKDPTLLYSLHQYSFEKNDQVCPIKKIDEVLKEDVDDIISIKESGFSLPDLRLINEYILNKIFDVRNFQYNMDKVIGEFFTEFNSLFSKTDDKFPQKVISIGKNFRKTFDIGDFDNFTIDVDDNYEMNCKKPIDNSQFMLVLFLHESMDINDNDLHENIIFLKDLFSFTFDLITHNAIIPDIFQLKDGKYFVRWIPAIYNENVLDICYYYYINCPDDLITYNGERISKKQQVLTAISFIFTGFFNYFRKSTQNHMEVFEKNDLFQLFFTNPVDLSRGRYFDYQNIICSDLKLFNINQSPYDFELFISENRSDINVELKVYRDDEHINILDEDLHISNYIRLIWDVFIFFHMEPISPTKLLFRRDNLSFFINNIQPFFEHLGVKVTLPFVVERSDIKVLLDIPVNKSYFTLDMLCDFDWKVAIADKDYSLNEFKVLTKKYGDMIRLSNKYVVVDYKKLYDVNDAIDKLPKNLSNFEMMQRLLSSDFNGLDVSLNEQFQNIFENFRQIERIDVPDSLKDVLRPYQEIGYSWLVQNIKCGFGSILADDMGLGKTLQVLAAILHLKENKQLKNQVLVIAPTSLLSNWQYEIEKFIPQLNSIIYHGTNRKLQKKGC